jgi:hypothetical protein
MNVFPLSIARASAAMLLPLFATSLLFAQTTVSFQQGINDYQGTVNIFVGPDTADIPLGADGNTDGAFLNEDYMDGKYFAELGTGGGHQGDQELQMLLRFDEIFGAGPGQIPLGSKIANATLTLTTGNAGNAQSGGPYSPAQLLVPFDTTTTWNTLGGDGATYSGAESERPLDRGFAGMTTPSGVTLQPANAEVTSILQEWSNGDMNHGFVVRAGTTDGWSVYTTGVPTAEARPKLTVTYEPAPAVPTTTVALQQNVGGYMGTTMAWVQGPCLGCGTPRPDPITTDGALIDGAFIDGANAAQTSPDDLALIKFNNIFASQGGTVPDNATILSAKLIVDSTSASFSANVDTGGNFGVHQLLQDWTTATLHSEFGTNGLKESDGEIGPLLDVSGAVIADSRASFDVLAAVEAWQDGEPNFGLSIQAETTDNGWSILWLGSSSPPQLVIEYAEGSVGTEGDFDGDGDVDGRDFLAWQRGESPSPLSADDLAQWQAAYNGGSLTASATAVPEPTACAIVLVGLVAAGSVRRRG